ncbi:unnamed protein product [Cuscuta europaea]|uniref:Uncharacterized protein n=1 Tax=Cuscuta europaea TaxID=41803 RepID=A0A9P0Z3I4_CUSEU|nr:unnamed protein product [Cuscuta europaea]
MGVPKDQLLHLGVLPSFVEAPFLQPSELLPEGNASLQR